MQLTNDELNRENALDAFQAELEDFGPSGQVLIIAITFLQELEKGDFSKKGDRYVYEPNFVTFAIHNTRVQHVTVTFAGKPEDFPEFPHLPLKEERSSYSKCNFDNILQLDALLSYLRHAHGIWKGRTKNIFKGLL